MTTGRLQLISDEYERLVNDGQARWEPVNKETLDPCTVEYLETVLEPSGLTYMVAEQRLQGTVLFKVNHPNIRYLHHDPQTGSHMWAGDGFHEALPNNAVFATLAGMAGVKLPHGIMLRIFDEIDVLANEC